MDAGYDVRLCHPAKADRYDGLKYGDGFTDARWLAEMRPEAFGASRVIHFLDAQAPIQPDLGSV